MTDDWKFFTVATLILAAMFALIYFGAREMTRKCQAAGGHYYHRVCVDEYSQVIY